MNQITYNNWSQDELIQLINRKNRQVDSQRSMLNRLRISRDKLQSKVAEGRQVLKENDNLKADVEKLTQRIVKLLESGRGKAWSLKEYVPAMINAIMGYHKARKEGHVTNNEMAFLALAYQKEVFHLSDIQSFNKKWGRNPDFRWRSDFRNCCDTGLFHSSKYGRRTTYFISWRGRQRLESLLWHMFAGN